MSDLFLVGFVIAMVFIESIQIDLMSLLFVLVGLIVSLTIEIVWLYYYGKNWIHSVHIDSESLIGFRRYSIYFGIVACVFKFLAIIVVCVCLFIYRKKNPKNYTTPKYEMK
jgi:hypothetical protein